jgi:regulator of sigma E protease
MISPLSIIYGIVALSFLILVHELGHFLFARLFNVKVLTFSLGFGKKLIKFTKGETEYALSLVPLGGYVKLLGESEEDEVKEEDLPRSYSEKPPLAKMLIAFSGPLFNILFAGLIFAIVFASGYQVLTTKVGEVQQGFPASTAGIQPGDVILRIEGKEIGEWSDLMEEMAKAPSGPLKFSVQRGENRFDLVITPREIEGKNIFGETIHRKVIGVTASSDFVTRKEGIAGAASKAVVQTYNLTRVTILGIVKLVAGSISPRNIGGPLMILDVAGKQAKEGKKNLAYFIAIISINLGVVNLLPIPILDGGHILFHIIELVTRRKVSQKWIEITQKIGLGILICIMALAFFNDIMRLFFGK